MEKIGIFQILGAAISTIGMMFLIIFALSYTGLLPIVGLGMDTAMVSFLMATNGFMILLFGIMTGPASARRSNLAISTANLNRHSIINLLSPSESKKS